MSEKEKKHKENHGETAEKNSAGKNSGEKVESGDVTPDNGSDTAKETESVAEKQETGGDKAAGNDCGDSGKETEGSGEEPSDKDRIAELEKQSAENKDLYMRKAAEFENYRKRMIREKQEAIDFANSGLLVDLIQVLDDFDRAISAAGEQEAGSPAAAFVEGVLMIRRQMASMLENKYGLVYYPSVGEVFDPNIHEAIGRVPAEDVSEPVVQEECRKGYKLKERVIRLAQVIVKTPPEK